MSGNRQASFRVWLIGEHNPYRADPKYALYPYPPHAAGGRLAKVLGLQPREYLRRFVRRNLLTQAKWSVPLARDAADAVLEEHPPDDKLVLLGSRVSAAFGLAFGVSVCAPKLTLVGGASTWRNVLVLPHPSGRSRAWNDPATAPKVRAAMAELCGETAPTG